MRAAVLTAIVSANGLVVRPAPAQPTRVMGRVLDQESRRPIEAVEVRLVGEETEFSQLTDPRGEFIFPRVPAGAYELVLDHLAYGTRSDSIEVGGVVVAIWMRSAPTGQVGSGKSIVQKLAIAAAVQALVAVFLLAVF